MRLNANIVGKNGVMFVVGKHHVNVRLEVIPFAGRKMEKIVVVYLVQMDAQHSKAKVQTEIAIHVKLVIKMDVVLIVLQQVDCSLR